MQGVIFDLDGTLTNTLAICVSAFREAIEPLAGRAFTDAEIIATFGPSEEGTLMALVPEQYEAGLAGYLRAYEQRIATDSGLFAGTRPLLDALQATGIPMALVTGKGAGSTRLTLDRYKLNGYFSQVATGSLQGSVKALRIAEIVAGWGMDPASVVYVGDAPSDVLAAREAGVRIVSALWAPEADPAAVLALAPDAFFASLEEFKVWLLAQISAKE